MNEGILLILEITAEFVIQTWILIFPRIWDFVSQGMSVLVKQIFDTAILIYNTRTKE